MKCPDCKEGVLEPAGGTWGESVTLVGYFSPAGHNHDDNCKTRQYICNKCKEPFVLSVKNKCPNPDCDWEGKKECFCHYGVKLETWP